MNFLNGHVRLLWVVTVLFLAGLLTYGCGPSEEATDEEAWETPSVTASSAPLQSRVDSLVTENKRLTEQMEAVLNENRSLRGRVAELETKISETAVAPIAAAAVPLPTDGTAAYSQALDQFMARNYDAAIAQFDALLRSGAAGDRTDNCHYWIGESEYAQKNYRDAIQAFERVGTSSSKAAAARLMIGNSYAALGQTAAARDAYNKVITAYPGSSLTAKAQEKLNRLR